MIAKETARTVFNFVLAGILTFIITIGSWLIIAPKSSFIEFLDTKNVVTKVTDGDTFELATGEKVRLIGIDTPEIAHGKNPADCFGVKAKEFTKSLIYRRKVTFETDINNTDKFNRLLRYVFIDGKMLNKVLVSEGYARAKAYPPDTKYQSELEFLEQEARAQGKGLWSECVLSKSSTNWSIKLLI